MRVLYTILGIVIGSMLGGYYYSNLFDPDRFLANANSLAANSYLMGCLEGKTDSLKEKPFSYEVRFCKAKAQELFDKLETLRKDPGHRVTTPQ